MPDLTVAPGYLEALAAKQDEAAAVAATAASAASGLGTEVWVTHGVVCGASNTAFTDAEEVRRTAGEAIGQAAASLAARLRAAQDGYSNTDERTCRALDQLMRSS